MHELTVIAHLVRSVEELSKEKKITRVHKLKLLVGELQALNGEALQLAFAAASKNTVAEEAVLEIERVAAQLSCEDCLQTSACVDEQLQCALCGGVRVRVTQGKELILESVEGEVL